MLDFVNLTTPDLARGRYRPKATKDRSSALERDSFYRGSYPFIRMHFENCRFNGSKSDSDRLWQAMILVYSWMGRSMLADFQQDFKRYKAICPTLRTVRNSGELDEDQLVELSTLCQGSVIAASKFLHFLRPDRFAIWDSRISAAIFGKAKSYSTLNNPKNYLAYLEWIRALKIDRETQRTVTKHLHIPSGNSLRAKEFILFMSGPGLIKTLRPKAKTRPRR